MSAFIKLTSRSGKEILLDADEVFAAERAPSGETTLVLAGIEVLETCEQVKQKIAVALKTSLASDGLSNAGTGEAPSVVGRPPAVLK